MRISGERVSSPAGGFNPTWQRHVAAYELCEQFLGPGKVLDLGCGVGHSYSALAPRETVGVDVDAAALAGQERETVVADMRETSPGPLERRLRSLGVTNPRMLWRGRAIDQAGQQVVRDATADLAERRSTRADRVWRSRAQAPKISASREESPRLRRNDARGPSRLDELEAEP